VLLVLPLRVAANTELLRLVLLPTPQKICAAAIWMSGLDYTGEFDAQDPHSGAMLAKDLLKSYLPCELQTFGRPSDALSYTMPTPCHGIFRFDGLMTRFTPSKDLFTTAAYRSGFETLIVSCPLTVCLHACSTHARPRHTASLGRSCLPSSIIHYGGLLRCWMPFLTKQPRLH
jgi:hypothetical protein